MCLYTVQSKFWVAGFLTIQQEGILASEGAGEEVNITVKDLGFT